MTRGRDSVSKGGADRKKVERGPTFTVRLDRAKVEAARSLTKLKQGEVAAGADFNLRTYDRVLNVPVSTETATNLAATLGTDIESLRRAGIFVAPPRHANIVGRSGELAKIAEKLKPRHPDGLSEAELPQKPLARIAIHGQSGVGKSSLATEYVHLFAEHYSDIYWCQAETETQLLESLGRLAVEARAVSNRLDNLNDAAREALRYCSEQTSFLLIYDNVRSPEIIAEYLPFGNSFVLITSTFADWPAWADTIPLEVLPGDDAAKLLQERARRSDQNGAEILAKTLGYLPLALDHAAAYCLQTLTQFTVYSDTVKLLLEDVPRGVNYPRSVFATVNIAMNTAMEHCGSAQEVMEILAFCSQEPVPLDLLRKAVIDDQKFAQAVCALSSISLIKGGYSSKDLESVIIHRLVQVVAQVIAERNGRQSLAVERLLSGLKQLYPTETDVYQETWVCAAQLTPHALSLGRFVGNHEQYSSLLKAVGTYFCVRALYRQAEAAWEECLKIDEFHCGASTERTLLAVQDLSLARRSMGEPVRAWPLGLRAVIGLRELHGTKNLSTAAAESNFALVLSDLGQARAALPYIKSALDTFADLLDDNHPTTAKALSDFASLLQSVEMHWIAKPFIETALQRFAPSRSPDDVVVAHMKHNLAVSLRVEGDLSRSLITAKEVLVTLKKVRGPGDPLLIYVYNNIGLIRLDRNEVRKAGPAFVQAIKLSEKIYDHKHTSFALAHNGLGLFHRASQNLLDARIHFGLSCAVYRRQPYRTPSEAAALMNLAETMEMLGDRDEAIERYDTAIGILAQDEPQPNIVHALLEIARLVHDQDDFSKAVRYLKHACRYAERLFGPDDPRTLELVCGLERRERDLHEYEALRSGI